MPHCYKRPSMFKFRAKGKVDASCIVLLYQKAKAFPEIPNNFCCLIKAYYVTTVKCKWSYEWVLTWYNVSPNCIEILLARKKVSELWVSKPSNRNPADVSLSWSLLWCSQAELISSLSSVVPCSCLPFIISVLRYHYQGAIWSEIVFTHCLTPSPLTLYLEHIDVKSCLLLAWWSTPFCS